MTSDVRAAAEKQISESDLRKMFPGEYVFVKQTENIVSIQVGGNPNRRDPYRGVLRLVLTVRRPLLLEQFVAALAALGITQEASE